jgi:hypothetical protein
VDVIKGVIGFSFHLFGLKLVVLVDSFSHVLEPAGFGSFLQNDRLALCFHLFGEKFILLFFELIMKFLLPSLLFLFFEDFLFLILVHTLPMVGFDPVSVEF